MLSKPPLDTCTLFCFFSFSFSNCSCPEPGLFIMPIFIKILLIFFFYANVTWTQMCLLYRKLCYYLGDCDSFSWEFYHSWVSWHSFTGTQIQVYKGLFTTDCTSVNLPLLSASFLLHTSASPRLFTRITIPGDINTVCQSHISGHHSIAIWPEGCPGELVSLHLDHHGATFVQYSTHTKLSCILLLVILIRVIK